MMTFYPFVQVSSFGVSDSSLEGNSGASIATCASFVLRETSTNSLPASLSALSPTSLFRSSLLAGDEAGYLLLIDPRVGGATSVVLRLCAGLPDTASIGSDGTFSSPPLGISEVKLRPFGLEGHNSACSVAFMW